MEKRRKSIVFTDNNISPLVGVSHLNHLGQLAVIVQLYHDVRPADELSVYVQLWDGGPHGIRLDAGPDVHVLQHIHGLEGGVDGVQDTTRVVGEATEMLHSGR